MRTVLFLGLLLIADAITGPRPPVDKSILTILTIILLIAAIMDVAEFIKRMISKNKP